VTYGFNEFTSYPFTIFSDWVRRLLDFVVPGAFVAYYPVLGLLGKPDPLGLPAALQWCTPLVALVAVATAALEPSIEVLVRTLYAS
jgi:ABC-2 type transport system permease protein